MMFFVRDEYIHHGHWFIEKYDIFRNLRLSIFINSSGIIENGADLCNYITNIDKNIINYIEINSPNWSITRYVDNRNVSFAFMGQKYLTDVERNLIDKNLHKIINYIKNMEDWDLSHFILVDLLKILS